MSAVAMNNTESLAYTQGLRQQLVAQFMQDGKFPADPKMLNILLTALKDHDKVTLTTMRIDADSDTADADRAALVQFHRLSAMMGTKDLSRVDEPEKGATNEGPATPFDPNDIPSSTLVEGELATGADPVNYDDFMAEQTKLHSARTRKQQGESSQSA